MPRETVMRIRQSILTSVAGPFSGQRSAGLLQLPQMGQRYHAATAPVAAFLLPYHGVFRPSVHPKTDTDYYKLFRIEAFYINGAATVPPRRSRCLQSSAVRSRAGCGSLRATRHRGYSDFRLKAVASHYQDNHFQLYSRIMAVSREREKLPSYFF